MAPPCLTKSVLSGLPKGRNRSEAVSLEAVKGESKAYDSCPLEFSYRLNGFFGSRTVNILNVKYLW